MTSSSTALCDDLLNDIVGNIEFFAEEQKKGLPFSQTSSSPSLLGLSLISKSGLEISTRMDSLRTEQETVHLAQLRVLRQRSFGTCGYHALYNTIHFLKSVLAESEEQALTYLRQIRHHTSFWFQFIRWRNTLLEKMRQTGGKSYPFRERDILPGLMERGHVKYLIKHENPEMLHNIKNVHFASLPELGVRALRMCILTPKQIAKIQKHFDQFRSNDRYCHGFIIGSGTHWISVVAVKHVKCGNASTTSSSGDSGSEYEVILMDSSNTPSLGVSDEDIMKVVVFRMKRYQKKHPAAYKTNEQQQAFINSYFASVKDTQYSVQLIADCATGKKTFTEECVNQAIEEIMVAYNREVLKGEPESKEPEIEDVLAYFQSYYTAPVLRGCVLDYIQSIGIEYAAKDSVDKVLRWAKMQASQLIVLKQKEQSSLTPENLEELDGFINLLQTDIPKLFTASL